MNLVFPLPLWTVARGRHCLEHSNPISSCPVLLQREKGVKSVSSICFTIQSAANEVSPMRPRDSHGCKDMSVLCNFAIRFILADSTARSKSAGEEKSGH